MFLPFLRLAAAEIKIFVSRQTYNIPELLAYINKN